MTLLQPHYRRFLRRLAACAIGGAALFLGACSEPASKSSTDPPAASKVAPAHLRGEAFLKLNRGTEALSGLKVALYDRTLIDLVTRLTGEAEQARTKATALQERVAVLEQCKALKRDALQWYDWQQKIVQQKADFDDKGYEQFQVYDPIKEEDVVLSWHRDKERSLDTLDRIIYECKQRSLEATRAIDEKLKKLPVKDGDVDALLEAEQEKLRVEQSHSLQKDEVILAAQAVKEPLATQLTDANGQFEFPDLPPNKYVFAATYSDEYSGTSYYWCLPVDATTGGEQKAILSQASTCHVKTPASRATGRKVERPDPLLPPTLP
jgi:hypothetical protein